MTDTTQRFHHTPGPWEYDMDYIVAPDPSGIHADIYIAEIAHDDEEGRVAPVPQQDANRRLIAAAPRLLGSLRSILAALERLPIEILDLSFNFAVDTAAEVLASAEERE